MHSLPPINLTYHAVEIFRTLSRYAESQQHAPPLPPSPYSFLSYFVPFSNPTFDPIFELQRALILALTVFILSLITHMFFLDHRPPAEVREDSELESMLKDIAERRPMDEPVIHALDALQLPMWTEYKDHILSAACVFLEHEPSPGLRSSLVLSTAALVCLIPPSPPRQPLSRAAERVLAQAAHHYATLSRLASSASLPNTLSHCITVDPVTSTRVVTFALPDCDGLLAALASLPAHIETLALPLDQDDTAPLVFLGQGLAASAALLACLAHPTAEAFCFGPLPCHPGPLPWRCHVLVHAQDPLPRLCRSSLDRSLALVKALDALPLDVSERLNLLAEPALPRPVLAALDQVVLPSSPSLLTLDSQQVILLSPSAPPALTDGRFFTDIDFCFVGTPLMPPDYSLALRPGHDG